MFRNELSYKDCYKNFENNEKYKILRGHRQNFSQENANKERICCIYILKARKIKAKLYASASTPGYESDEKTPYFDCIFL